MKITNEDYSKLQAATRPYLTPENWEEYQDRGLSETRFLFDMFHLSVGREGLRNLRQGLYSYLTDDNIHVALRRIWRSVNP